MACQNHGNDADDTSAMVMMTMVMMMMVLMMMMMMMMMMAMEDQHKLQRLLAKGESRVLGGDLLPLGSPPGQNIVLLKDGDNHDNDDYCYFDLYWAHHLLCSNH